MCRDPDCSALIRHGPADRLPDPPDSISGEAVAKLRIELFNRPEQAQVALLDEVLEGETHPPVILGHRDHQSEVALYQLFARPLVSGASASGEGDLLLVGQELAPPDLRQVACEEPWGFQLLPQPSGGADLIEPLRLVYHASHGHHLLSSLSWAIATR